MKRPIEYMRDYSKGNKGLFMQGLSVVMLEHDADQKGTEVFIAGEAATNVNSLTLALMRICELCDIDYQTGGEMFLAMFAANVHGEAVGDQLSGDEYKREKDPVLKRVAGSEERIEQEVEKRVRKALERDEKQQKQHEADIAAMKSAIERAKQECAKIRDAWNKQVRELTKELQERDADIKRMSKALEGQEE